ncbi:MAG: AAA family ATPase [Victivallaceae bacterium]
MMKAHEIVKQKLKEGMVQGEMHLCLRDVGRLAGGYAAGGAISQAEMLELESLAVSLSLNNKEGAKKWQQAVEYGRKQPVVWEDNYVPDVAGHLDWNDTIKVDSLKVIKEEWLEEKELPPAPMNWNGINDLTKYLQTVFQADEHVCIVADAYQVEQDDGSYKWMPKRGASKRTAGELIEELSKAKELGEVIGDWPEECGAWIRFNPMDGKGSFDKNVSEYRYALVESDVISIERQYTIIKELELPVVALVHSAGKSLHAIVKIEAADYKEYQKRVDFLYDVCKRNGLVIDRQNRNPSRLSRLPGATRNGKQQRLVDTNIGQDSWKSWEDWIAALNDDLPDVENSEEFVKNPPDLADNLIEGVLRQGHKMLMAGPSKAGKSFMLLELAVAIAEGDKWLGWQCTQGRVLYVNLELDRASCYHRLADVYTAMDLSMQNANLIDMWHLRGQSMAMDKLAPKLIRRAIKKNYIAIIIDPIYKVITGDENSADQMAKFCNQFDKVCYELKASVIYCHHHSKGQQGQKSAHDRASGSGVFARDPDALLDMIQLDITEAKRKQIINVRECEVMRSAFSKARPNWMDDCDEDTITNGRQLAEWAEKNGLGDVMRSVRPQARKDAEKLSAWRIGGILREFASFKPVNCFFNYPIHPVDMNDELTDCLAIGEPPPKISRKEAVANKKKLLSDETFKAYNTLNVSDEPVTVKDMAEYLGISNQAMRDRIKNSGKLAYKKGTVYMTQGTNQTNNTN